MPFRRVVATTIINVDNLKCDGQCPKLIQALVMLITETKHSSMLIILFKIFHEILLKPGAEELLYLLIAFLNSSLKKRSHSITGFDGILFKISMLILQICVELKKRCKTCYKSLSLLQDLPLN